MSKEKTGTYFVDRFDLVPADAIPLEDERVCSKLGVPPPVDEDAGNKQVNICNAAYKYSLPQWCNYDFWTKEEAARLLSGMLPISDSMGEAFEKNCWSIWYGSPDGKFQVSKLLQGRFDCERHILEIMARSNVGDSDSPTKWAKYASAKGLLPNSDLALSEVDFRPLLSLVEKNDSDGTAQNKPSLRYSTKWLEIQQAAIEEFFDPRPDVDAKSEVVIPWIEEQAIKVGITSPNRIAAAIFTIIKPEGHDPKKKRVAPQ